MKLVWFHFYPTMVQKEVLFFRIVILLFFFTNLTVQKPKAAWSFKFDPIRKNNSDTDSRKRFPEVTVNGSNGFSKVQNISIVDVSVTSPSIIFTCVASYPIEWVFDNFPSITDNTRKWDMNNVRKVTQLENTTSYIFESTLLFTYRPPLEPRQQTCRSTGQNKGNALQTKISTSYEGQNIRMIATSFEDPPVNLTARYGSNPNCGISMTYDDQISQICCHTPNTSLFTRGCSDFPSCKGFFTKTSCGNVGKKPEDMNINGPDTQCLNYTELIAGGSSGVVVCKANGVPDSYSATFNYFPSVPNLCLGNSKAVAPYLYVNMNEPSNHLNMLQLCEPESKDLYVGENVDFKCHGSFYYLSSGFRWVLKRKGLSDELLEPQDENLSFSNFPSENNIIKSVRSLQQRILMNDTRIYEVFCLAPVWNTYDWVNKSVKINVKEPKSIIFQNLSETITYDSNMVINCSASGDPIPEVKWENFPPDLIESLNQSRGPGWATLLLPSDISILPEAFKLTCTAIQNRIQASKSKSYKFFKPTESNSSRIDLLFLLFLLLPILIFIIYILWKKSKPFRHFRQLSPIEIEEFLYGRFGFDVTKIQDMNTKVMLMPYDRRFELKSKHLKIGEVIQSGAFGIIKKGTYKNLKVALKTCKPFADILFFKALLSELKLMIHLGEHKNIVNLVGARTKYIYRREVYIATEYCENGNLLQFLQDHRVHFYNDIHRFTDLSLSSSPAKGYVSFDAVYQSPYYLVKWAKEIAEGMEFLSSKKVIHGDLAARNILLTGNLTAKLSDFGLSHQLANYYVYIPNSQMPVPAKWLAPECLLDLELTVWSDVWAYGVTLWEIFTLGDRPWEQFKDSDIRGIYGAILGGERVAKAKPPLATFEIYNKMFECWEKDRQRRCSFEELVTFFSAELGRVATMAGSDRGFLDDDNEYNNQVLHI